MIQVNQISRIFQSAREGDKQALFPVSLNIDKGEIFGLLGPNGAGKTTLLRILATVIKPTTGTAVLNGHDIIKQPDEVKKSLGFLSGNTKLYGRLTTRELLTYFGRLYEMEDDLIRRKIDEILAFFDISELADRRIDKLSTGQTQRISIARCILHDPPIYILDEPTSGLDIISSRTIVDFIRNAAASGKTVLFSTHYMEEAEMLCNRIGFLHEGRLIAVNTIDGYRRNSGLVHVADIFMHHVKNTTAGVS